MTAPSGGFPDLRIVPVADLLLHERVDLERVTRLIDRLSADGIARIEAATAGEFVPQVINYDLTGHISFNKGCYTGQEVVARLHYRGKPKRRSIMASLTAAQGCAPGAPLFDATSGQNVGDVVNCSTTAQGTVALVSATASGAANGLRLGAADGPPLALGQLPYAVEAE